jgi:hypothetical protein
MEVTAQSSWGTITLHLPRTFRGLVTVSTTWGSVRFSEPLTADMTPLGEANGTQRYFVGRLDDWTDDDAWVGDEVRVETSSGNVKLQYEAEPDPAPSDARAEKGKGKGSFFGRLLGR